MRILFRLPVCSGSSNLIAVNQLAERGYYPLNAYASRSNVRLAGVKVTTGMSAWIAMSPPYPSATRYAQGIR
jgi:hypothetical protein